MIDLSRNEAISGPPRELLLELAEKAAEMARSYPWDLYYEVEDLARKRFAQKSEDAILTRGVDEAIDRMLCQFPARSPAVLEHEFSGFFERFAAFNKHPVILPFKENFQFPLDSARSLTKEHLWFVSTPH